MAKVACPEIVENGLKKEYMRVWSEFKACERKRDEKVEEYLDRFKRCYVKIALSGQIAMFPGEMGASGGERS